jgi:hypothetical protein
MRSSHWRRTFMFSAIRLPTLVLVAVMVLAACSVAAEAPGVATLDDPGASSSPAASTAPTDPQEAFLAFAKCMRDHGIDMPDPQFSGDDGGFNVSIGSPDGGADDAPMIDFNSDEFKEANEACGGPDGGGFVFSSAEPADG